MDRWMGGWCVGWDVKGGVCGTSWCGGSPLQLVARAGVGQAKPRLKAIKPVGRCHPGDHVYTSSAGIKTGGRGAGLGAVDCYEYTDR